MIETALIGGTGVYDPELLENVKNIEVNTRYGAVEVITGDYAGNPLAFIPRHGAQHNLPPHLINYQANIMALKQLGVKNILATAAVGSLHFDYRPGDFILADQFLDFTHKRADTFFTGGELGVIHCDMTVPYCPELREALMRTAAELEFVTYNGGVYVCTEGPRFETAAEIAMFKALGGQLVGMTSVPEVCLARELGMCYANISIVTNYAAGLSSHALSHREVLEMMDSRIASLRQMMLASIKYITVDKKCVCANILEEQGVANWLEQ